MPVAETSAAQNVLLCLRGAESLNSSASLPTRDSTVPPTKTKATNRCLDTTPSTQSSKRDDVKQGRAKNSGTFFQKVDDGIAWSQCAWSSRLPPKQPVRDSTPPHAHNENTPQRTLRSNSLNNTC